MKKLRFCLLVASMALTAHAFADDPITIVTTEGKKYENVTIVRVDPDSLAVMTDSGIERIEFSRLPKNVQSKYGYSPQAGAAYSAAVSAAKRETLQRGRDALDQQRSNKDALYNSEPAAKKPQDDAQKREEPAKPSLTNERMTEYHNPLTEGGKVASEKKFTIKGKVFQVLDGGILVDCDDSASIGYAKPERDADGLAIVYLKGYPQELADGSRLKCTAIANGLYKYTAVNGAARTVQCFLFTQ